MKLHKPFLIAGIWFILGLIYSSQSFFYYLSIGKEYVWQRSLFHSFVFCIEWGLLTAPVLWLSNKYRLDKTNIVRNILFHFVLAIIFGLIQQSFWVVLVDFVESGFVFKHTLQEYIPSVIGFFEFGVLMYWSILFVSHATKYYRDYQTEQQHATELRSQLIESQLQSLKMQLQPHFLFNTLNAISVLVKKEPLLAQKMIVRLSDLLRLTLERGNENQITLGQELEFLNTYLAIEKVRFGKRLKVNVQAEEKVMNALVPTFILQPLAENAVRHGIAKHSGSGWIMIQSNRQGEKLTIEVSDGGAKQRRTKPTAQHSGVGLENTKQRLQQMYGNNFRFDFKYNDQNGATVKIEIPLNTSIKTR